MVRKTTFVSITTLFFITFLAFNVGVSPCEDSVNGSIYNDTYSYLQYFGSKERLTEDYLPYYRFGIENDHITIIPEQYNSSIFLGEPSYRLGFRYNNINDDDYFVIDVWIIGMGDVDAGTIDMRIPPQLVEGPIDLIRIDYYLNTSLNLTTNMVHSSPKPMILLSQYNDTNINRNIPVINFYPYSEYDDINLINYGATIIHENSIINGSIPSYPANWCYKLPKGSFPAFNLYKIIFKINKDAPAGDYSLKFDLFYKWEEKWHADSQSVPLHINYIYEKPDVQKLIIFFAIIGIICELDSLRVRHITRINQILAQIRALWTKFF